MSISYAVNDHVGSIVIDHGPGNRIDAAFIEELGHAADAAAQSSARAVVISASGEDFSGGGAATLGAGMNLDQLRALVRRINQVFDLVEAIPVPTIAAVQGRAWGGGIELALRADFILADQNALFRFPEATVGVLPLAGGAQRLAARVGVAVASRAVMLTDEIPAAELGATGLLTVTPSGALIEHTQRLATRLASGPTQAHAGTKAVLAAWARSGLAASDEVMMDRASRLFGTEDVALAATGAAFVGR